MTVPRRRGGSRQAVAGGEDALQGDEVDAAEVTLDGRAMRSVHPGGGAAAESRTLRWKIALWGMCRSAPDGRSPALLPAGFGVLPIPAWLVPCPHPVLQMAGDVVPVSPGDRPSTCSPMAAYTLWTCTWAQSSGPPWTTARRCRLDEVSERNEQTPCGITAHPMMRHEPAIPRQALARHTDLPEKAGIVSSE